MSEEQVRKDLESVQKRDMHGRLWDMIADGESSDAVDVKGLLCAWRGLTLLLSDGGWHAEKEVVDAMIASARKGGWTIEKGAGVSEHLIRSLLEQSREMGVVWWQSRGQSGARGRRALRFYYRSPRRFGRRAATTDPRSTDGGLARLEEAR